MFGGAGNDTMSAGDGADLLDGGDGDDLLEGRDGNDTLLGKKGDDTLRGEAGDDILDGKLGGDVLTGGEGADRFLFTVLDGQIDRVTDLELGVDQLDLSALLPANLPEGYELADYVRFTSTSDGLLVAVDPSGSGASFTGVVLLEGVSADQLTGAQLGLPGHHLPIASTVASSSASGAAGNGISLLGSLSADGRYVTFASSATNLVGGDDATFDVFRKDLATGEIIKLSAGRQRRQLPFGDVGRWPGDRVRQRGDQLLDRQHGPAQRLRDQRGRREIELVSIVHNRFAADPSISDDGTLVSFTGTATGRAETGNPAPVETITERVFVRDPHDGSLIEASTDADGNYANGASRHSEISGNGEFVVFAEQRRQPAAGRRCQPFSPTSSSSRWPTAASAWSAPTPTAARATTACATRRCRPTAASSRSRPSGRSSPMTATTPGTSTSRTC